MSDLRLQRALEDSLRAMRRGASVEQCLAFYGDLRSQLQPLLATATGVWREESVAMPDHRRSAIRSELMSAIAAEPQRRRQAIVLPRPLPRPRGLPAVSMLLAPVAVALVVAVLIVASGLLRSPSSVEASTVLTILQGEVNVQTHDGLRPGANGMRLRPGDSVITSPGARAVLTFFDGSTVTLDSDTVVIIRSIRERDGRLETQLVQVRGSTWTHVPTELDTARIEIDTPNARVQTRDASFATTVQDGGRTQVDSQSGALQVTSGSQSAAVQGGQQTAVDSPGIVGAASSGNQPSKELVLRIRGPVYAVITDPSGATIGTLDPGVPVNQVSGASATREGDTLIVRIPDPGDGRYALGLRSAGDGEVTVVAEVLNGSTGTTSTTFAVSSSETLSSGLVLTGDQVALADVSRATGAFKPEPVTVPDKAIEKARTNVAPVAPTLAPPADTPTRTPVPPTKTPTPTPVPPTSTKVPPTNTPVPSKPTATPTKHPTVDATPIKQIEPIDSLDVTSDATSDIGPSLR